MVLYPNLIGQMAIREIQRKDIANCLKISDKALQNKLSGKSEFTWPEVNMIQKNFFPDYEVQNLFATKNEPDKAS